MDSTRSHLWRSRWAAVGAAVAITLGAGGLVTTFAASAPSSLVAIAPVRVLDTRLAPMAPALRSDAPRLLDVTGAIPTVGADGSTVATATVVPDGATAIVANVTIVSPTTAGFVAIRPGTATGNPSTSSINATASGVIIPNSVTVELPTAGATAGQIQLWFTGLDPSATAHLLIDIVGYYVAGAAGPAGPPGPAGLAYIGTFGSAATVAMGSSSSPPAPASYTGTFDLTPGRYLVTGDLTILNGDDVNAGFASCSLYVNNTAVGRPMLIDVGRNTPSSGFANLTVSNTFEITVGGSTTVSLRCYRASSVSALNYWYANYTLFALD